MNTNLLDLLKNEIYVKHHFFTSVFQEIMRFIQYGGEDECLCVIGPTGIGKTKMINFTVGYLREQIDSGWNGECSYPIVVEAPSELNREFQWRAFLEDILIALGETEENLAHKSNLDAMEEKRRIGIKPPVYGRPTIGQLERMIRTRVKIFKPVALIIDEAQNLVDGVSELDRKANVNRLKNWANTMDTRFLLFGTHESSPIVTMNEQLTRRNNLVYFPRYTKNETEVKLFAEFYKGLKNELNISIDSEIDKDFIYTYNHTLGCPGLLVGWIHRCISYCIDQGKNSITLKLWKEQRLSSLKLSIIETAIKHFELQYESNMADFNPDDIQLDFQQQDMDFHSSSKSIDSTKGRKPRTILPGRQKPRRHQVGIN